MANQKKDSLSTLFSEEVHGPFVTFLFNPMSLIKT